jgi:hypothetical protein
MPMRLAVCAEMMFLDLPITGLSRFRAAFTV